jgi:hypothetical protein
VDSKGSGRGRLLTAGGILSIVGGACEICSGGLMVASAHPGWCLSLWGLTLCAFEPGMRSAHIPFEFWREGTILVGSTWFVIIGVPLLVLGVLAVVGGISAMRRKRFGLSLTGAICALPSVILGILGIVFVSMSKREFGVGEKQSGI